MRVGIIETILQGMGFAQTPLNVPSDTSSWFIGSSDYEKEVIAKINEDELILESTRLNSDKPEITTTIDHLRMDVVALKKWVQCHLDWLAS